MAAVIILKWVKRR